MWKEYLLALVILASCRLDAEASSLRSRLEDLSLQMQQRNLEADNEQAEIRLLKKEMTIKVRHFQTQHLQPRALSLGLPDTLGSSQDAHDSRLSIQ